MVKQLRIHYGDSFPTSVRKFLIPFITANLADAVVRIVKMMQESNLKINDSYANELATQLIQNRPPEGYTLAVSFAYYNKSLSTETSPRDCFNELKGQESISDGDSIPKNYARSSAHSNSFNQANPQINATPNHAPSTPIQIKLCKSLEIKEIQSLLGSLYPEVDWSDVMETEVFMKAPKDADESEVLIEWLEKAFKAGKLNPLKVMAALQERVCNPHIRKLPAKIAAQLPPPDETPPTPPSTSVPDLDDNILTDADDWSSDTSFQSEEKSLNPEEISAHSNESSEENQIMEEKEIKIRPSLLDDRESFVANFREFDYSSLNGRMLKIIIDQSEFQVFLRNGARRHLEMSTSQS